MDGLLPLLVLLVIIAALLREDSVLVVFYLLGGIVLLQRILSGVAFRRLAVRRVFERRAFFNQPVPVTLELDNHGWLPVIWLKLHESLPLALATPNFLQQVVTLGPHGRSTVQYTLQARKRGVFMLGPTLLESGDLLGFVREHTRQTPGESLIVYPRIYPLEGVTLFSQAPFGAIAERRPIFEDPARVRGKRDYVSGDSLRRVDWKATAVVGRLQVKNYEPSIALAACLALDLHAADYDPAQRLDSVELAVVTAASLAAWVSRRKQAVGLATNGVDRLESGPPCAYPTLPPRTGNGALMQVLEVLARVQPGEDEDGAGLLRRAGAGAAWGSTLVLITSLLNDAMLNGLLALRARGLQVMAVAVGPQPGQQHMHARVHQAGVAFAWISRESDLEIWQTER